MAKFIIKRCLSAIPVLIVVLVMVFFLMRFIPGNPIYFIQEDADITPEQMEMLQEKYGLNESIFQQFAKYIKNVLRGDWGESYFNGKPVFENIRTRMEPTAMITVLSMLITLILGVPLGMYAATHHNSRLDYILSGTSMILTTIPSFCLGIGFLYLFAFKLRWFPMRGYTYIADGGFWKAVHSAMLPSLAVGLCGVASFSRHTRSQMLDVLGSDYIRTARAKGLSERLVNYRHAMRGVLAVLITIVSNSVLGSLGGAAVLEGVFNIQGVGLLALDSISRRDYSQEQAILVFFAVLFVFMNIMLDIVYKLLDPRVELD